MADVQGPGSLVASEKVDGDAKSDDDELKRGIHIATGFIAYRQRSEFEVTRRLRRASISDTVVPQVLSRLRDNGLIDDRAFAAAYTRDQMHLRSRGPARVRNGLLKLGVARDLIDEALKEAFAGQDPLQKAVEAGTKRWARLSDVEGRKRRKRVYDYLVRQGYPFDVARRAVDVIQKENATR